MGESRRDWIAGKVKDLKENITDPIFVWHTKASLSNQYADLMEDYENWKRFQEKYGHINHLIEEINDTTWLLTGEHSHLDEEAW